MPGPEEVLDYGAALVQHLYRIGLRLHQARIEVRSSDGHPATERATRTAIEALDEAIQETQELAFRVLVPGFGDKSRVR